MEFIGGNGLALLRNGEQYFPQLVQAIDAAAVEVFLETYIFADDRTGKQVAEALARAAARGVAVHLLLDGFGARDFAPHLREMLTRAGAGVLVYRPKINPLTLRRNRLRRMHRKMAVVDTRVAFVGGINIIDDFDAPEQPPRYDHAVRFEGPLVGQARAEAAKLWARVAWATQGRRLPRLRAWLREGAARAPDPDLARGPGMRASLVVRDNFRHRRDIEKAYLALIERAREEIMIANAYFFPGRRFRRALADAAKRGVRVTLLLQGRVEYVLLHYASRALYGTLLDAGIEIHEYHSSFLHTKVAVFDTRFASVGSSNIDPFSLLLSREVNVFVDDPRFAGELRGDLLQAVTSGAQAVPSEQWQRQPFWLRVRIWIAYGITRLLMNVAGTGREH